MKRYFILGTDTDCGKTYVTGQLVCHFKQQFANVVAIKPVVSGTPDDVTALNEANGFVVDDKGFWRFEAPISPHLAAKREGVTLSVREMVTSIERCSTEADILLIEGAGGLMVPLNDEETWVDFLIHANIPVLLVVGMRLGCLNHALLTANVLQTYQIHCEGWIANCLDEHMLALDENIETLNAKLPFPLFATVAYKGRISKSKSSSTMSM